MPGFKVKVNTSRSEGDIAGSDKSTELLKDILDEIKKGNTGAAKQRKLGFSGLLGGAGGLLSKAALALSTVPFFNYAIKHSEESGFADVASPTVVHQLKATEFENKLTDDGNEIIIEKNKLTGKIVNILTVEEGIRRGIADKTGKVKDSTEGIAKIFGTIQETGVEWFKSLTKINKKEEQLVEVKDGEFTISMEIVKLLARKRDRLLKEEGGRAELSTDEVLALGKGPLRQNIAYDIALRESSTPAQKINDYLFEQSPFNKKFVDLAFEQREI